MAFNQPSSLLATVSDDSYVNIIKIDKDGVKVVSSIYIPNVMFCGLQFVESEMFTDLKVKNSQVLSGFGHGMTLMLTAYDRSRIVFLPKM